MKKSIYLGVLFLGVAIQTSRAQSDSALTQKRIVQYVGAQINPLIRQVFNFNNSNQTIVNPYLLTYSFNWLKSGNGIRIGAGVNYMQTTTNDGISINETNEIDYEFRLGYEKIFRIAKRWEVGAGIDLVVNNTNNFTKTTPVSANLQFNIEHSQTNDLDLNYGGGPMVSLRFYATKRILIGTETSIYYTRGFPTVTTSVDQQIQGQPDVQTITKTSSFSSQATVALPVAFYLILKF